MHQLKCYLFDLINVSLKALKLLIKYDSQLIFVLVYTIIFIKNCMSAVHISCVCVNYVCLELCMNVCMLVMPSWADSPIE